MFSKRHTLPALLILLVLITSVFSVAAQDNLSGTLTVAVDAWMIDKYNMAELEARFEADHPNVDVVVISREGDYTSTILEWTRTGASTADLYFGGAVSQIAPAIIDDLLVPWDDVMVGDLAPDMWLPGFLEPNYIDGEAGSNYPSLPGLGELMTFQFNASLFDQAGLTNDDGTPMLPTTYDEIETAACAVSQLTVDGTPITNELHFNVIFAPETWIAAVVAANGTYLNEQGRIDWGSEASRQWIAFQKKLVDEGCSGTLTTTDPNAGRNGQKAGQVAIANESSSRATENSNSLCPEQGEFPCPSGEPVQQFLYPGGMGAHLVAHQVYIPRVAARPDLAHAFAVEQLFSEYAQTWSAIHYGKLPTLKANFDALPANPNFDVLKEVLQGAQVGPWTYRDGEFLRQTYTEELQLYLTGQQDLDTMIDHLNAALDDADLTTFAEMRGM